MFINDYRRNINSRIRRSPVYINSTCIGQSIELEPWVSFDWKHMDKGTLRIVSPGKISSTANNPLLPLTESLPTFSLGCTTPLASAQSLKRSSTVLKWCLLLLLQILSLLEVYILFLPLKSSWRLSWIGLLMKATAENASTSMRTEV